MSDPTPEPTAPAEPPRRWSWAYCLAPVAMAPALVFLVMGGVGATLPKDHVATSSAVCAAPPARAWKVITDFAKQTEWRPEIKRVERLPDQSGHEVWREQYVGGDQMTLETLEAEAPRRIVRRIVADGGPFSGSWETTIEEDPEGCKVTITEHGTVENPVFRFVSHYIIGHTTTMDAYLLRLQRRLDR